MTNNTQSESIAKLAAALAKAQSNIAPAKKDGTNPHFRSTFATLEAVIEACREPLYEHGLSYVQLPVHHDAGIGLTTMLMHSSGEWISATMVLPVDTQKGRTVVQAAGSTISYMRRYALMAMLGIATEDDDGASAGARQGDRQTTSRSNVKKAHDEGAMSASTEQRQEFKRLTSHLSAEQIQKGLAARGHDGRGFGDLSRDEAEAVLTALMDRQNADA